MTYDLMTLVQKKRSDNMEYTYVSSITYHSKVLVNVKFNFNFSDR